MQCQSQATAHSSFVTRMKQDLPALQQWKGNKLSDFISFCSMKSYFIAKLWHFLQNLNSLFSCSLRSSNSTKKSSGHLDIAFNNLLVFQSHRYNESRGDKRNFIHTTNKIAGIIVFFFLPLFKILSFINQNLTALGPELALLLTISQSYILLFQYNLEGNDLWWIWYRKCRGGKHIAK